MEDKTPVQMGPLLCMSLIAVLGACSPSDERLVQMSQESLARQAEQNRQIAKHNDQLAQATRRLVESDAAAREQLIDAHGELQQGIQAERLGLNEQQIDLQRRHDRLEDERRQIAQQRQRDPIIAGALFQAAALLACSLPLLFCFCLLRSLRQDDHDSGLAELLVDEVLADQSMLFAAKISSQSALSHRSLALRDATKSDE